MKPPKENGKVRNILFLLQTGKTSKQVIELGYNPSTVYKMACCLRKYAPVFKLMKHHHADNLIMEQTNISEKEIAHCRYFFRYII